MSELLLGCGNRRNKIISLRDSVGEWKDLTTVDIDPDCGADVIHDLNVYPWPFADDSFDEIHAYEVLEHLGRQGDYVAFFQCFNEIWRILKPDGLLFASVPTFDGTWTWGDPGHTRVINDDTLTYLNQLEYRQIGATPMTDYRRIYKGDLRRAHAQMEEATFGFVLQAFKGEKWAQEQSGSIFA